MEPDPVTLSDQELAVLRLLSLGWHNTSIGDELGFGKSNVGRLIRSAVDKLWPAGFPSDRHRRTMLALYYQRFYGGC